MGLPNYPCRRGGQNSTTLPSLAQACDPAQPTWSVTLDHCFARIILDNTVRGGQEQRGQEAAEAGYQEHVG